MGRFNIVKMSILPKIIYSFNSISIKYPKMFSSEIGKSILKFTWLIITMTASKRKNNIGGFPPNFKTYYRATVIKMCGTGIKTNIQASGID